MKMALNLACTHTVGCRMNSSEAEHTSVSTDLLQTT